jgi:hypothetical protein
VIDYDRIRQKSNELGQRYEIREIAIDRGMPGDSCDLPRESTQTASQTVPAASCQTTPWWLTGL